METVKKEIETPDGMKIVELYDLSYDQYVNLTNNLNAATNLIKEKQDFENAKPYLKKVCDLLVAGGDLPTFEVMCANWPLRRFITIITKMVELLNEEDKKK